MTTTNRPYEAKRQRYIQKQVMLVSRDLGEKCFGEHLDQIMKLAERERCETVMFALYTVDDQGGKVSVSAERIFASTGRFPKTVILECGGMEKEITYVEVFSRDRGRLTHKQFVRHFAMSTESRAQKEKLIQEFRRRNRHLAKSEALVICGESNCIKTMRDDRSCLGTRPIDDELGFLRLLRLTKTEVVLNPWHTYCRRPEANWKRAALSRNKRFTLSVWNKWKAEIKGEARTPWVAFYNGKNVSERIREIETPVKGRPDIRIGVFGT
jgi:hypothetical protein